MTIRPMPQANPALPEQVASGFPEETLDILRSFSARMDAAACAAAETSAVIRSVRQYRRRL